MTPDTRTHTPPLPGTVRAAPLFLRLAFLALLATSPCVIGDGRLLRAAAPAKKPSQSVFWLSAAEDGSARELKVGRKAGNTIRIDEQSISRHHATLRVHGVQRAGRKAGTDSFVEFQDHAKFPTQLQVPPDGASAKCVSSKPGDASATWTRVADGTVFKFGAQRYTLRRTPLVIASSKLVLPEDRVACSTLTAALGGARAEALPRMLVARRHAAGRLAYIVCGALAQGAPPSAGLRSARTSCSQLW